MPWPRTTEGRKSKEPKACNLARKGSEKKTTKGGTRDRGRNCKKNWGASSKSHKLDDPESENVTLCHWSSTKHPPK